MMNQSTCSFFGAQTAEVDEYQRSRQQLSYDLPGFTTSNGVNEALQHAHS